MPECYINLPLVVHLKLYLESRQPRPPPDGFRIHVELMAYGYTCQASLPLAFQLSLSLPHPCMISRRTRCCFNCVRVPLRLKCRFKSNFRCFVGETGLVLVLISPMRNCIRKICMLKKSMADWYNELVLVGCLFVVDLIPLCARCL